MPVRTDKPTLRNRQTAATREEILDLAMKRANMEPMGVQIGAENLCRDIVCPVGGVQHTVFPSGHYRFPLRNQTIL